MRTRWERYLERWTGIGLIEPVVAERIRAYEVEREQARGLHWQPPQSVILRIEGDRLVAEANPSESGYDPSALHVRYIGRGGEKLAVLNPPVAFFITEHIPDPSRHPPGEELWAEVTIPKKGPPRPIRLGIKKGESPIAPLQLR